MDFSFLIPGRFMVQRGAADSIGAIVKLYMGRVCIFRYGESFFQSGTYDRLKRSLDGAGLQHFVFEHVKGEPSPQVINDAAQFMREHNCDGALAVGGGSVIDAAKAACALAPNGHDIMDYIEGFNPQPFAHKPLPVVAMPTTAGTGSECTKNSVITQKGSFKNSVRDDSMLPAVSIVDAGLMLTVPQGVTATAGADCICQLVESYVSKFASPVTDALALHFTTRAFGALKKAYDHGGDADAREEMGLCASAGGMAMANAGLGAAHGLAAGFGALTPLEHGLICGVTLPHVMRFNIANGILKYADIARAATGTHYANDREAAMDAVHLVEDVNDYIGIPRNFKDAGINPDDAQKIARASMGSSMSKNPVEVTLADCEALVAGLL